LRQPGKQKFGVSDVALLTVTVIWGINNVAVKYALRAFSPLAFNSVRFVLATTLIFGLLLGQRRPLQIRHQDLPRLVLIGILGNTLYQLAFIKGINLTSAGNAAFVLATMPATIALLAHLLGLERLSGRAWCGIAVALAGVAAIIAGGTGQLSFGGASVRGDLTILSGTLGWCLYTILSRPLLDRYTPTELTAWTMAFGTVPLVLLSIPELMRQDWSHPQLIHWTCVVGSGSLALVFSYVAWYRGLRNIGTTRTAIYGNLTPLWAGLFSWLLLGEGWNALRLVGAGLVLAGVTTVRVGHPPSPAPKTPSSPAASRT